MHVPLGSGSIFISSFIGSMRRSTTSWLTLVSDRHGDTTELRLMILVLGRKSTKHLAVHFSFGQKQVCVFMSAGYRLELFDLMSMKQHDSASLRDVLAKGSLIDTRPPHVTVSKRKSVQLSCERVIEHGQISGRNSQ